MKIALLLALFATACSSDSCSSGCGGLTPLPGGFPNDKRIENAAGVRITQQGMDFLEQNIGALAAQLIGGGSSVMTFQVPKTEGGIDVIVTTIDYTICPDGSPPGACTVEIDLASANLSVTPTNPHNIQIAGTIPIRLADLPIDNDVDDLNLTLSGNNACPNENATFANVNATFEISLETDLDPSHQARFGYSKVRVVQLNISKTDLENAIEFCNGGLVSAALNFFKGFVVDQIYDQFLGSINGTIEEQLCQKSNPMVNPPCPLQSTDDGGICRYTDGSCVPMALGLDGHANLAGLLASISPGSKGGMDFVLAGGGPTPRDDASGYTWGDLNPIGGGATVGAFGGVEPNPISGCVPLSQMALPQNLRLPDELLNDSLITTGWPASTPGPHVGIGVSESFFNYALNGMYNSGLLCIGISTETVDLLNSDTLGLLAQSLKNLALQRESAPVALVLKPRQPPKVTFGNGTNLDTDPLINLELNGATFDFYIWSSDRFIRFMTASFDIKAPVNLSVTPDGLVPVLDKLSITNGQVSNTELIKEDPAVLAATLQSLLAGQIGSLLGGGIGPVDINGSLSGLGLELVIPPSVEGQGSPGLRTVTKNGERYLGIFAGLQLAGANMAALETKASVEEVNVDERGLRAETLTPDNSPEVVLVVEAEQADGSEPAFEVEHQVRIDGGVWKPWQKGRILRVTDETLRLEGRHQILVRSRPVHDAYGIDPTPEELEVLIDTQAPAVKLLPVAEDGTARLDVWDLVSRDETLVRYRFDDESFTSWRRLGDIGVVDVPEDAEEIEIEAVDETGRVGKAQQEIIRGAPRGDGGSGCGCAVPGSEVPSEKPWGLGLGALAGILALSRWRRRSRVAAHAATAAGVFASGAFSGCSCDDDETKNPKPAYVCEAPNCVPLQPGLIGSYTSTAVASDGTLWVAGYLEGDYDNVDLQGQPLQYGDLVVGKFDGTNVAWEVVDGVPSDPPPDGAAFDLNGFRGGQTAPGDDVGLWTSIGLVDDKPVIAYYDRTNKALKYAESTGSDWTISTVDDGGESDIGRYASLVVDGGTPTIAYLALEPAADGFITSKVKIARGSGGSFTTEDAVVNTQTPCTFGLCGSNHCVKDTGLCSAETAGCDSCSSPDKCVLVDGAPTCSSIDASKAKGFPMATGLYVALAPIPSGGLGLAYYDRVAGTVVVAAREGSNWVPVVVDGGLQADGSYSDVGVGLSLFIDSNGWHLTYVDGYNESLKYARVVGGVVQEVEVIDDGLTLNGTQNEDGLHVIGDDSFITVTPAGEVHVTYQDATAGKLRYAVGTSKQGGHDWSVRVASTESFGGFFSSQVTVDGATKLVSWWRRSKDKTEGNVSVVSPP